ncbi:hypothetical protein [Amycolatopsis pithecellobii]|uniref:Uncharacterized protein n=1 Tax=Amycolatopsis pithecellobii TaxID=664692 RepID=A0A6N7YNN5_9PSEU|nr:hypothetical protein [Amycolatopsis pithecellobii]MTD53488.1 hypothetical protein [Amycolatopsis pithecellobii]
MYDGNPLDGGLRTSVHQRLDDLARAAGRRDPRRAAELSRQEIPLLVQALRSVLAAHEPDEHGHCPVCHPKSAWLPFRRHNRLPCRAYLAVQLRLGNAETAVPLQRRRHRATHLHSVS